MTEQELLKIRKEQAFEWQRQALDAFLLGMEVLQLTGREQERYMKKACSAVEKIDWTSYDSVRRSFMNQAADLLKDRGLFLDGRNMLRQKMYIRFMEGRIRFFEFQEKQECCPEAPIPVGESDFHNTELAAVFAHLPAQPEVKQWLENLGVSWNYDQLHMVTWFSGQLSLGTGKYSRSRPNHSARVTYQRLLNPYSLLWIAAALGENEKTVQRAAVMAAERETFKEKCIVIRNMIPFSRIYELALPLVEREKEAS